MNLKEKYKDDISVIMSKINHDGGELWATKDRGLTSSHKTDMQ
jgi:predicted NUDIX family NTP pyrophosphohydrolase